MTVNNLITNLQSKESKANVNQQKGGIKLENLKTKTE